MLTYKLLSLAYNNVSNLIGRSGVHIFIRLKRGRKIFKVENCFVTQAVENLVATENQPNNQVHKKLIANLSCNIVLSTI